MSQAELLIDVEPPAAVVSVAVAGLPLGSAFRSGGLCSEQVDRLVELGGSWPPIVVSRIDGAVVDGAHRVAAARRLGLAKLDAVLFEGGAEEAFVEFVRRNVCHGLVLTLDERKAAAVRVLRGQPLWSDRRVAELCALSPKTVARLRADTRGSSPEDGVPVDSGVRVGRDQRVRPARRGSVRPRVLEALQAQPGASLRTIAAAAGVSPETVRLVRLNVARDPELLADVDPIERPGGGPESEVPVSWACDAALTSSASGEDFVGWFEKTAVGELDLARVQHVPLSRVYLVADEARRRSEAWIQFARALEARSARIR